MSELSAALARNLAMLSYARRSRKRRSALKNDRTLQTLVADLVGARAAAGMTQQQVAARMWTTKSAVSRLESGRYARPNAGYYREIRPRRWRSRRDSRATGLVAFSSRGATSWGSNLWPISDDAPVMAECRL